MESLFNLAVDALLSMHLEEVLGDVIDVSRNIVNNPD